MADLLDECLRVIESLNDERVDYVVIGGVAINFHGLIRATEDIDIFIRPDPQNVARLRAALKRLWDDPAIDEITAEDLCGEYPSIRYGPPTGDLYLDILTRIGEAVEYEDLEVVVRDIDGVSVRIASPATLYRMKRNTVRPLDHADAAALAREFDLETEDE